MNTQGALEKVKKLMICSDPKFSHHKYTWTKLFGVRHNWELLGPTLAIHFHVSVSVDGKYPDTAGLEIHYFTPPEYMANHAPSHTNCQLVGGRCWHDGTSLYAMETLWPMIKPFVKSGNHEAIFNLLEGEARNRMEKEE